MFTYLFLSIVTASLRLLNKMNDDCKIYKKYSKVILSPPGTAATGEVVTTGLMTRVSHPILVTVYLVNLLGLFIVLFYSLHEIPKQMACWNEEDLVLRLYFDLIIDTRLPYSPIIWIQNLFRIDSDTATKHESCNDIFPQPICVSFKSATLS